MASVLTALGMGFVARLAALGAGFTRPDLLLAAAGSLLGLTGSLVVGGGVVRLLAAHSLQGFLGLVPLGLIVRRLGIARGSGLSWGRAGRTTATAAAAAAATAGGTSVSRGAPGRGGAGRGVGGRTFGDHVLGSRGTAGPAQRLVGMVLVAGASPQAAAAPDREAVAHGRCGGRVTS